MTQSPAPPLFIGIDGGGTRSAAVAIDERGAERARVAGAASLIDPVHPGARAVELAELARRAAAEAGGAVHALCCGVAGAGREAVRAALERALVETRVAVRVRVVSDADAAFYDAFADGPGLLLVAGTGSVAYGHAHDGRVARVGGWGMRFGDEGSGYAIGIASLRAVAHARDGRVHDTLLTDLVLAAANCAVPEELVAWAAAAPKADVAGLAPLVLRAARAGDAAADAICDDAADALLAHVRALLIRLAPWPQAPVLALAGGLLGPDGGLRTRLLPRLAGLLPAPAVFADPVDAARGAARRARALAGEGSAPY